MNPLLIAQLLSGVLGAVATTAAKNDQSSVSSTPTAPAIDQSTLIALAAAMRPQQVVHQIPKAPASAGVIGVVVALGFFATLAAIVALALVDKQAAQQAFHVLCVAVGIEGAALLAVVFYWYGSSWGSRSKDAVIAGGGGGETVVPVPVRPSEPVPTEPAPEPVPEPLPEPLPPELDGIGPSTSGTTSTISDVPANGTPASIRYNNPGAQYPASAAERFGQIGYGIIGGGHKIARFPHPVNGAASNFDLLSRSYTGMTFGAAGQKWTGSNGFGIPGYSDSTVLTKEMVADPATATPIMKSIAKREAGKANTLTDTQWQAAHAMFIAGSADAWMAANVGEKTRRAAGPTGADVVALARTRIGEKYVNVLVPKDDANWHGPWDCAEFASWLVYQVAGVLYGCTDDTANPATADAYTGAWKTDASTKGRMVSVSEAAGTPGAFLLRYPPAPGEMGHIAVSDGQGGTIEAAGSSTGVVAGKVSGRRWDTGVLPPGIDYTTGSHSVAGPSTIYAVGQPNMAAAKIKEIQTALAAHGFTPGEIDGEFGTNTALAAAAFQRAQGLIADGEVGPDTAKALGITL